MKELKLYISDDEKVQGTYAEVEAYEAALNPLAKFHFPWLVSDTGSFTKKDGSYAWGNTKYNRQLIALLNLMPLVEELRRKWNVEFPSWRPHTYVAGEDRAKSAQALLLDYEKALGIEQPA